MMAEINEEEISVPEILPLLPVRDVVIFPYMILPLFVGREGSIKAIDEALSRERLILLVAQKDPSVEEPGPDDIYHFGTISTIMRMLKLPDGRVKVLAQGLIRARIKEFIRTKPSFSVRVEKIPEKTIVKTSMETEALKRNVKEQMEKVISLGKSIPPDFMLIIENIEDPGRLADIVTSNLGLKAE